MMPYNIIDLIESDETLATCQMFNAEVCYGSGLTYDTTQATAQALQKPYHDLLFNVHRLIIRFNHWDKVRPDCPFIQLTTLDENKDAKQVSTEQQKSDHHRQESD